MSQVGWWKLHKYKRHSVERDVEEFVGWSLLKDMASKAQERDAAFLVTAFFTGGRVTEVRMLQRDNFILSNPKVLLVTKMRVLKRFHREPEPNNPQKKIVILDTVFRKTFPIKRSEPLTEKMVEWIEKHENYIFPTNRGNEPYLSRSMAYVIARRLGDSIGQWVYPHWFRAQRASQLRLEYGFDTIDLMEYFAWEDVKTATRYAKMGWRGLAEKMGVK